MVACHSAAVRAAWLKTISAEWHARHRALAMSAPGAGGNPTSLSGNCTLTLPERASELRALTGPCARNAGAPATSNPANTASTPAVRRSAADLRRLDSMTAPSEPHETCNEIDSI